MTDDTVFDAGGAIVIGAGPAGLAAARAAADRGMRPILITDAEADGYGTGAARRFEDAAPVWLRGRRATSVWGSPEIGFNVELDTGETATGAAVIFAEGAAPEIRDGL
ncbi:MAG: FAD-binding protein, partial [Pseudomonadota bacterium]